MASRQFIFCDLCNSMGIRLVEERRSRFRCGGRRRVDGRAWVEGTRAEAQLQGWSVDDENQDVCAQCHEKGLDQSSLPYAKLQSAPLQSLHNH